MATNFSKVANNVVTTLASTHTSGDGQLIVTSATGFPATPFRVTVGSTIFNITTVSGNTFTIGSAIESTTDSTYVSGTSVNMWFTAGHLSDVYTAVNTLETTTVKTTDIGVTVAAFTHTHAIADVTSLQTTLDSKAPLASPTLTGTPLAPTATAGTNTTQIATTAFVAAGIATKSPLAGSSSVVTVGTITTGTWQATVIAPAYLGSGTPAAGKYVDGGTGAWTTLPSGGGSAGDMLANLTSSEVAVSSATSLTSSAFGKFHKCTGSSNYAVTLPSPSGNAGKIIGIHINNGMTALVTVQANSSETIDGASARIMWAGESAILLCDGTNWNKVAGKSIPMIAVAYRSGSDFSITSNLWTAIFLNTLSLGPSFMWDSTNGRLVVARPGTYTACSFIYDSSNNNGFFAIGVGQNSSDGGTGGGYANQYNGPRSGSYSAAIMAATGDYLSPVCYCSNSANVLSTVNGAYPRISLIEAPAW